MKTFFVSILLFSMHAGAQQNCNNQTLINGGWLQHPSHEFPQIIASMETETQNPGWVKDIETHFFSGHLEKMISFKSLDNLATDDLEMFGDVAYYSDFETQEILEIRWYENGRKHFVLRQDLLCTVDDAPLAENTLF